MHIAITTYSSAQNFGALLQAHALSTYINSLGHECELLNTTPFDDRKLKPRREWKDIAATLFHFTQNFERIRRYRAFIAAYLPMSAPVRDGNTWEEANAKYDAFITGSDQVWNCLLGINKSFFLSLVHEDRLKCSYAASFGSAQVPGPYRAEVEKYLSRFQHISVRERSGCDIVRSLTGRDSTVCLDPVFLHSPEYWRQIAILPKERKPYAFVYSTQVSPSLNAAVAAYARRTGHKIITTHSIMGTPCSTRKDIGPREFLGYILNAEYVVTTSFHALAFCILFGKGLCVVPHSQTSERVENLLTEAHLTECLWNGSGHAFPEVDFNTKGLCRLQGQITASKDYLKNCLTSRHD